MRVRVARITWMTLPMASVTLKTKSLKLTEDVYSRFTNYTRNNKHSVNQEDDDRIIDND